MNKETYNAIEQPDIIVSIDNETEVKNDGKNKNCLIAFFCLPLYLFCECIKYISDCYYILTIN